MLTAQVAETTTSTLPELGRKGVMLEQPGLRAAPNAIYRKPKVSSPSLTEGVGRHQEARSEGKLQVSISLSPVTPGSR